MVPTWDLVLLIFFAASLIYGFLMGKEKVIVTLLGAYVGLVVANQWADSALGWLTNQSSPVIDNEWVSGNVSVFMVKVTLFIISILVIALCSGLAVHSFIGGNGVIGLVAQLVYSLMSAALIATSIISFLPEDSMGQLTDGSVVAAALINYYDWLLILPVILMLVAGWWARRD